MSNELAICPSCGGHFNPMRGRTYAKYCCLDCERRAAAYRRKHGTLDGLPVRVLGGSARWRELNDPKLAREKRMARRDSAYAANAPKVTVEEHVKPGGRVIVIETRGQRCIGFRACGHVSHN